jgi:fumarate hydratase subunit alpha
MITRDAFVTDIVALIAQSEISLPEDVVKALEDAWRRESNPTARSQLAAILENIKIAKEKRVPLCQDTGIFLFEVTIGGNTVIDFDIRGALCEALRIATKTVPLRPNTVHPLRRENSMDNTGVGLPDIKFNLSEGEGLEVSVYPKGAGSENMSRIAMFKPTQIEEIKKFVVETVFIAGGMPCPPVIVGVGIGGCFDLAARLAKRAALRPLGEMSDFERELCDAVNALGIGAMGLGGDVTALSVHVETAYCHTASLPVAVNIQCWANRRAYKKFL